MAQSIPIPPEHSSVFLRKAAIVQHWVQQIHTKTPGCGKGVQIPHPGNEANGMRPSKEAKNHTQRVSGRNSFNFTCESET